MRIQASNKGVLFVSLLAITVVVLMLVAAFLSTSRSNLFYSTHYRDGIQAEQIARAGANVALELLRQDPKYASDISGSDKNANYLITFNRNNPYFSVNNLSSDKAAADKSFQKYWVAPRSADLIVVGKCGGAQKIIHLVVNQGFFPLRSIAAVGRVDLSGPVSIDGVKDLTPPLNQQELEPAAGGIVSKFRTTSSGEPAISWDGSDPHNFSLGPLCKLETAPADSGVQSVGDVLYNNFKDKLIDKGATETIPYIDIAKEVTSGMSAPELTGGGSTLGGYISVEGRRSVDGDLTVNGNLVLTDGTLYVNGKLKVNGGIQGLGAVYVKDDLFVNGGNAMVQTGDPSGTCIMVGGKITLQGLDAQGYLNDLALAHPSTIGQAYDKLSGYLTNEFSLADDKSELWSAAVNLSKHSGGTSNIDITKFSSPPEIVSTYDSNRPADTIWVHPLPGPGGEHVLGYSNGLIPKLINTIRDTGIPASDAKAAKIVRALEQMAHHFRDNDFSARFNDATGVQRYFLNDDYSIRDSSGATLGASATYDLVFNNSGNNGAYSHHWDDKDVMPFSSRSYSSIAWGGTPSQEEDPRLRLTNADSYRLAAALARKAAYIKQNPLDFSWLGKSSLQGIIYAGGDINVDTEFTVLGSLVSQKNISLNNGANITYVDAYRSLFGERMPLGVSAFEEL